MQFISNIQDIANQYDYFIFDVWGVVHDGNNAYPGAIDAISYLRKKGKKICFLSNAPRRAHKVAKVLEKFGVTSDLYDFVMSSGEATYLDLEKNQANNFANYGPNYLYIGPEKDLDLLDGLNYNRVDDAANANFAVATGFDGDDSTLEEKLPHILEAKKHNLDMICVNPDMIVVRQNGVSMICAGAIAKEYARIGGNVSYYGKPYMSVYKTVCEIFKNVSNKKMLMIGDGLETDIKGANSFGIDSLLLTGGILSKTLGITYDQEADASQLKAICDQHQQYPTFVISNLKQ